MTVQSCPRQVPIRLNALGFRVDSSLMAVGQAGGASLSTDIFDSNGYFVPPLPEALYTAGIAEEVRIISSNPKMSFLAVQFSLRQPLFSI